MAGNNPSLVQYDGKGPIKCHTIKGNTPYTFSIVIMLDCAKSKSEK